MYVVKKFNIAVFSVIEPSFDENGFIGRKLLSTNSSQGSSNKTEKPRCNEPSRAYSGHHSIACKIPDVKLYTK